MKFFTRLRERREADRAAIENSQALLDETLRTEPEIEHQLQHAHQLHKKAVEQASRLRAADYQNHYSESLTHAFRGKPA